MNPKTVIFPAAAAVLFVAAALRPGDAGTGEKAQAGAEARVWSFDADKVGETAKGFTSEVGEWRVAADDTAPSPNNVLAQAAKSSGTTFNLVLAADANYRDVDLSVQMKAVAGEEDQGGGLVWRARDRKNYYLARHNPLEDNYRLYKVVDGKRTQLATADLKAAPGWHRLRVVMKGDHIECFHDGKKHLEVIDTTWKEPGKIGLWTKADARSQFDDLRAAAGEGK